MPDWPEIEYCEVVGDYTIRKVLRTREGGLLKDSVDCSWSEGLVTLSESALRLDSYGDLAVVEQIEPDAFEAMWAEAEFVGKEGDQRWVFLDTTKPTDPNFEPVLGACIAAHGSGEVIEFTLNGIVPWTRPNEPMQFFRYTVDGSDIRLDPETGKPVTTLVLQVDVLVDDAGRRFVRE